MEPETCRAARALLNWSRQDLARASGVASPTLDRFERKASSPMFETVRKLKKALQTAGVVFIEADEIHSEGVRLRRRKR